MIANKAYIFVAKKATSLYPFYGENFPKLDIDTSMDLCYIGNKFLQGLFCKNVHVFVKGCPCNKCALLQGVGRYGQRVPQCYYVLTPSST